MKLYVLRHGETDENITGVMQGNMETVLNETGKNQAISVRKKVKEAKIDLVISSPKKRTLETALLAAPNIPLIQDDRLLSRDHGEFQGMKRSEINLKEYWNIKLNKQYEKAETMGEIFNRVSSLLNDISINYSDKTVLLVTHSGITRVLYYYFNGFPEDGDLTEYESTNCSFEQYEL
ncbi:MAG: histidine phosphatase family protein [Firmicutes bacterium]|nr:histidine phosphatase family protein [Bacillota bacterium]